MVPTISNNKLKQNLLYEKIRRVKNPVCSAQEEASEICLKLDFLHLKQ